MLSSQDKKPASVSLKNPVESSSTTDERGGAEEDGRSNRTPGELKEATLKVIIDGAR